MTRYDFPGVPAPMPHNQGSIVWVGVQGGEIGWLGRCTGGCQRVYALEMAAVDANGYLLDWVCASGSTDRGMELPLNHHTCNGRVRELPLQHTLLSAWHIGGIDAVYAILDLQEGT